MAHNPGRQRTFLARIDAGEQLARIGERDERKEDGRAMARYARVTTISSGGRGAQHSPEATIAANRAAQLQLAERALLDRPDIVCLTETITWYGLEAEALPLAAEPVDGPTVQAFAALARRGSTYVVVPIYTRDGGLIHNSAVLLDRQGKIAAVYRKMYPTVPEIERGVTPGVDPVVVQTDFGRIGFAICFDLNFREVAEGNRAGGAELVLFPSMYEGGLQLSIWAHDFGFFIASATPRNGGRFIDPVGRLMAHGDVQYDPILTRRLNLDYRVIQLGPNFHRMERVKERYGPGVEMDVSRPEAVFCLYSHLDGVSADDIVRDCALETRVDYFPRARRVREAALRAAGQQPMGRGIVLGDSHGNSVNTNGERARDAPHAPVAAAAALAAGGGTG
jgi:hypothetical protein